MNSALLRSRPAILMLAASLVTTLLLGVLVIVAHRLYDPPAAATAPPRTDDQPRSQVVGPARQFVAAGTMRAATAGYLLASCGAEDQPPYQGTVYLNFDVPTVAETRAYFQAIADAMTARGWRAGLPPGRHPGGRTLVKDGVYAVYYRDPDLPGRGVLKIFGECRDLADHRTDSVGFIDITGELAG